MEVEKEIRKLSDKVLHCLARIIQDELSGECVKCLYCKYALECTMEFKKSRYILFMKLLHELEICTSVSIFLIPKTKTVAILKGSWAEKYPDVLNQLTSKSFEEQQDILKHLDILPYLDSQCCK